MSFAVDLEGVPQTITAEPIIIDIKTYYIVALVNK